jgi:putative membrane protein
MTDTQFAAQAMESNLAQVQLGQLAMQKGDSDVKQVGQTMVADHSQMNSQLKPIAGEIGVAAPTRLSASDRALLASLKAKSGEPFDDAYLQAVMELNRAEVIGFGNEARIGKDQALKDAAASGARVIGTHTLMIDQAAIHHHVAIPSPISPPSALQP